MLKLAIFDFCETIVSFQTANAFVEYTCRNCNSLYRKVLFLLYKVLYKTKVIAVLSRLFPSKSLDKRIPLLLLKGLTEEAIDKMAQLYWMDKLSSNVINKIINCLKERQAEGYLIVVVSGGYSSYIKYFVNAFKIDTIIANDIVFKDGVCTGLFSVDCMGYNKVKYLYDIIDMSDVDLQSSYVYTDSISDMPLLSIVGHPIVVSKNKSQEWSKSQGSQEIIWS